MSIRWKLLLGSSLSALLIIAATSISIGVISYQRASESIQTLAYQQLTSTRELTAESIERYFDIISKQVTTFSNNRMVIDAMRDFPTAFSAFQADILSQGRSTYVESVGNYYRDQFGAKYQDENNDARLDFDALWESLDNDSLVLQYHWISENPFPLGGKDELNTLDDGSSYSRLHNLYHPHIRAYLQAFEYYDIFLVDIPTGDIVYSVFKELDYSTSLIDGPYRDSGIAEAFNAVKDSDNPDQVYLTTFSSYTPSYEAPAAFISSPVFDGDTKVGVLIFQMPIDVINRIMTHNNQWAEKGLGLSGETYLVGSDGLMQSLSRFLIEDEAGYIEALQAANLPSTTIEKIQSKGTSVGFQPVNSEAARKALAGETGEMNILDYRNVPVLSAYQPLDIGGVQMALLSEIDVEEAFQALPKLQQSIISAVLTISAVVLVVAALLALVYASQLGRQLKKAVNVAERVADGDSYEIGDVRGSDEIAQVLKSLDKMQKELLARFRQQHLFTNRIKVALDNSASNVLMLDNDVQIIYMNKAMLAAMTGASVARLDGEPNRSGKPMSQDVFHFIAAYYRENQAKLKKHFSHLTSLEREEFVIDGDTYIVTTSPVTEHNGSRLGAVIEWKNITDELLAQAQKEKELENQKIEAQRNARIKQALDNVSTNVLVLDAEQTVIYQNDAITDLFKNREGELQRSVLGFDATKLHMQPAAKLVPTNAHDVTVFGALRSTVEQEVEYGDLTFRITATPVLEDGETIGSVCEVVDRTEELLAEREVEALVEAAAFGDLTRRVTEEGKDGFLLKLASGLNTIMDTVSSAVKELGDVFEGMADGDLTHHVSGDYQGTFQKLKEDANKVVSELSTVVNQIRLSANTVATGANDIADGSHDLQQRSAQQTKSIEQASNNLKLISDSVRMQASDAAEANDIAAKTESLASNGGDVVNKAIEAMTEINQSSQKIADIISIIDEIAFQTNLLALNAAVESARAGEQGRGFAVVANEVRNLAQRSAKAAREITDLIKDSVQKVENGSSLVNASGETLKDIVGSVQQVSAMISSVSEKAREQSESVENVSGEVSSVDQGLQQNATVVDETVNGSKAMATQASEMLERLAFFKTNG